MSLASMPPNGLNLHGFAAEDSHSKHARSPVILFRLSDSLLEEVKKAPNTQGGLQFFTGSTPKIRVGSRTIDLTISNEAFRHELYSASTEALTDFDFAGIFGHRAELKVPERKQSVGGDTALAELQRNFASLTQEKEAKSVNISDRVVKEPKNRWEAAKEQKSARRRGVLGGQTHGSHPGSGSSHRRDLETTSLPPSESAERTRAMRTPLIHLLAMRPLSRSAIVQKTRIPKDEVDEVLQRIGKQDGENWQLIDRAYKELDVWKFGYSDQGDRQAAIDNAIRAYDRMRLGKDDKLWQMLYRREDRDKGTTLSKLHFVAAPTNKGLTPVPAVSGDEAEGKSTANTPRLGPASTPKVGPGKSDLSKRLFAKDPKKARAAEEAKDKKRKEREAAAAAANSDREGGKPARKKQNTKIINSKVKSEEIVRDSSDEGEVANVSRKGTGSSSSNQPKVSSSNERNPTSAAANGTLKAAAKSTPNVKAKETPTPKEKDVPAKVRPKTTASATPRLSGATGTPASRPASAMSSKTSKPAALGGKSTSTGLSAPSSQSRPQLSPQKGNRPTVPSPLGAARPRLASDVSDRGAVGIQRVRQGGNTPQGLGITVNGGRKRQDTVTSAESSTPQYPSGRMDGDHVMANGKTRRPTANGTSTAKSATTNGIRPKDEQGVKRKTAESQSDSHHDNRPAPKHRKTESTSSQSQKSLASSVGAGSSTDLRLQRSNSSDSTSSLMRDISYSQGIEEARKFRDIYYPNYAAEYDRQLAIEARGEKVSRGDRERLWDMHRRLEQMKQEIRIASQREHLDES